MTNNVHPEEEATGLANVSPMETVLKIGVSFSHSYLVALAKGVAKYRVEWDMLRSETREVF